MRKIFFFTTILISTIICFYLTCFILISSFCKTYNKNKSLELGDTKIFFDKISPSINLSKIGIKIDGIVEETENFTITHHNPVVIEIDPFTFNAYINYRGTGEIVNQDKKLYFLDANSTLKINLEYNSKILELIYEKKFFELINFITNATLEQEHVTILNKHDFSKIYHAQNIKLLFITKHQYYSALKDIINSPPKFYNLSGIIDIWKDDKTKLPSSIAYGIMPNFDIKGSIFVELNSEQKIFDFKSPLKKAKLKLICSECYSSYIDIDAKLDSDFTKDDISFNYSSKFLLKENLYKQISLNFKNEYFIKFFSPDNLIKKIIHSIEENAKQLITNKLELKLNGNCKLNDSFLNANIKHFIFKTENNEGIMISGKAKLNENLQAELNVDAIIINTQNVINYFTNYFYKNHIQNNADNDEVVKYHQQVNFLTAKSISEFPDSTSNDLMFKVVFDPQEGDILISNKKPNELLRIYYQLKYQELIKNSSTKKNPIDYINKVAPELSSIANELKIHIPSNIKIDNNLWKDLIK